MCRPTSDLNSLRRARQASPVERAAPAARVGGPTRAALCRDRLRSSRSCSSDPSTHEPSCWLRPRTEACSRRRRSFDSLPLDRNHRSAAKACPERSRRISCQWQAAMRSFAALRTTDLSDLEVRASTIRKTAARAFEPVTLRALSWLIHNCARSSLPESPRINENYIKTALVCSLSVLKPGTRRSIQLSWKCTASPDSSRAPVFGSLTQSAPSGGRACGPASIR